MCTSWEVRRQVLEHVFTNHLTPWRSGRCLHPGMQDYSVSISPLATNGPSVRNRSMRAKDGTGHSRNRRNVRLLHVDFHVALINTLLQQGAQSVHWPSYRRYFCCYWYTLNTNFKQNATESTHPFGDLPFDGLVGLGFPDVSGEQGLPSDALPIVDQMVKEVNISSIYSLADFPFGCRKCWIGTCSPCTWARILTS